MIPATGNDLKQAFVIAEPSSTTFKLNPTSGIISGFVDELEALKQAIYFILSVERYQHLIYSWNYGVELADLIGQPVPFCIPEIARRITEALLQDGRITAVQNFTFDVQKGQVHTAFEVETIFGSLKAERAVEI